MIKTIGHGWGLRTAAIAGACAMALAGAAGTAAASEAHTGVVPNNSSPYLYGPDGATLNYFCSQFSLWHVEATFDGTNNHGLSDAWVVTSVQDSTSDTQFQGVDLYKQIVVWFCG